MWDSLWNRVLQEWGMLKKAFYSFVAVLFIGFGAGFYAANQLYSHELTAAQQAVIAAQADRDLFKDKPGTPAPQTGDIIGLWGVNPPLEYHVEIDSSQLPNQESSVVVLVGRNDFVNVDPMSDQNIAVSTSYAITGGPMELATDARNKVRIFPGKMIEEFYVVEIPKATSPSQIHSLSDIKNLGGQIIAEKRVQALPVVPVTPPTTDSK